MGLARAHWSPNYDMSGRRRKKKQPKGEVYGKLKTPKFEPMPTAKQPSYADLRLAESKQYRSAEDVIKADSTARKEPQKYTGEMKLLGVATLHKSNMVPVFEESGGSEKQYAKDIANMRRN